MEGDGALSFFLQMEFGATPENTNLECDLRHGNRICTVGEQSVFAIVDTVTCCQDIPETICDQCQYKTHKCCQDWIVKQ